MQSVWLGGLLGYHTKQVDQLVVNESDCKPRLILDWFSFNSRLKGIFKIITIYQFPELGIAHDCFLFPGIRFSVQIHSPRTVHRYTNRLYREKSYLQYISYRSAFSGYVWSVTLTLSGYW